MQEERPVGDVDDLDPVDLADGVEDPVEVRRVGRQDRDVADLVAGLDANEVDRAEEAFGVGDRVGERGERAGMVRPGAPGSWR